MPALLRSPNRIVAIVLGAAFGGYGLLVAVTGRPVLGALFLAAAVALTIGAVRGIGPARLANIIVGAAWLALGYAGLFLVGTEYNIVGLGAIVEVVLFAAATVHLAVGLGARRDVAPAETPEQ